MSFGLFWEIIDCNRFYDPDRCSELQGKSCVNRSRNQSLDSHFYESYDSDCWEPCSVPFPLTRLPSFTWERLIRRIQSMQRRSIERERSRSQFEENISSAREYPTCLILVHMNSRRVASVDFSWKPLEHQLFIISVGTSKSLHFSFGAVTFANNTTDECRVALVHYYPFA